MEATHAIERARALAAAGTAFWVSSDALVLPAGGFFPLSSNRFSEAASAFSARRSFALSRFCSDPFSLVCTTSM